MTEIIWQLDASVLEKLRFRPSTLHHIAGDFEFLHSGDRLRWSKSLVWTCMPNLNLVRGSKQPEFNLN